jgi:hypothetical protein
MHPFKVETSTTRTREVRGINLRRPWQLILYHGLEVDSRVLRLLFGDLQFLLQGGFLLLRLARRGLLHTLDLLCGFNLVQQRSLVGRDDLCVGVGRLPQ